LNKEKHILRKLYNYYLASPKNYKVFDITTKKKLFHFFDSFFA